MSELCWCTSSLVQALASSLLFDQVPSMKLLPCSQYISKCCEANLKQSPPNFPPHIFSETLGRCSPSYLKLNIGIESSSIKLFTPISFKWAFVVFVEIELTK